MFTTLRAKLLSRIILTILVINFIFTIFISVFLVKNLKNTIIEELRKNKVFSVSTLEQGKIIDESIWKSLNSIKAFTNSYVSVANNKYDIKEAVNSILSEEEIKNILKESNNSKSIIRFAKLKDVYCVTYNYPLYLEEKFYCNLIIQKNYIEKYNHMIKTIGIILLGQLLIVVVIIGVIWIIVDRVTKPIKFLSNSMIKFTDSIEEEDVIINSCDEVGQLANTYNLMKNKLKNQMEIIVNEKEKVEKLQNTSKEFFNNATHELKTPIAAISLYGQILRDNDIKLLEDDFMYRATDRIVLESEKVKTLVEKILDISKGKINANKVRVGFELSQLIYEILEDFDIRIKTKGIQVNVAIKEVVCYAILEDIEQIITNLIDNSIKYTSGNEINIKLYNDNSNIIFEISNEFFYIPESLRGRLLEAFIKYNSYEDMTKEVSSSGLGLYLCSELVKDNGGNLSYAIENNNITFVLSILDIFQKY